MTSSTAADVIVVGGGIVGMATARALALRGASVLLSAPEDAGAASSAAAGVIAPTIDPMPGTAFDFACTARNLFPQVAASILEETGIDIGCSLNGVLRVALNEREAAALRGSSSHARWLSGTEVVRLEPALAICEGALLYESDGIVANEKLHAGLRASIRSTSRIRWTSHHVRQLHAATSSVRLSDGTEWHSGRIILAAGAWTTIIEGLPRAVPVEPMRGQMITYRSTGLSRAVFGGGGYAVPRREGRVLIGSTMERVGFAHSDTPEGREGLQKVAAALLPALATTSVLDSWGGLRPMTPDGLPILGASRDAPGLIFATGHSKNGILLGPLTGEVLADLVCSRSVAFDLSPFSPDRF